MTKIVHRQILVIGDNHKEIVKKYSGDTQVEPYVYKTLKDAAEDKKQLLELVKAILMNYRLPRNYEYYKNFYHDLLEMSDEDFFNELVENYDIDENGNAISTKNPNRYYQYERCYQNRLEKHGEEADFSDPFPLLNGKTAYSARYNEIDWKKIHKNEEQMHLASRVWEMVMEESDPEDEFEEKLYGRWKNRRSYFADNFKNKEEYVNHATSLWYYGVATEDSYTEVDWSIRDMDWVTGFYDRFISKCEKENPLITIYEVRMLDY